MPRRLPLTVSLVFVGSLLAAPVRAQAIDAQFRADIERLLQITGAGSIGAQMASLVSDQVVQSMKQSQPGVPDRVVTVVRETLNAEFAKAFEPKGELTGSMVGIYAAHFTPDEVKALLAFYATDVGRKAVSVLPQLAQEGAMAGRSWAQQNMPRMLGALQQRLRDEGLIK
jgi:hypothetical protein